MTLLTCFFNEVTIRLIELKIRLPQDSSPRVLRDLVLKDLKSHGCPLRWAITSVSASSSESEARELGVEAVVILSSV